MIEYVKLWYEGNQLSFNIRGTINPRIAPPQPRKSPPLE